MNALLKNRNSNLLLSPAELGLESRNALLRDRYLAEALTHIPRLWGNIDRNPYRKTFGCLDRQFWHYRTASFPSEMYQEGVLPLALVYAHPLPGNRWHGDERLRELAIAALRFTASHCHRDGSCDDYYPFERALGAAVFSLSACTEAYRLLQLDDGKLVEFFERRARWLMRNDESGALANHQALAALALERVAMISGDRQFHDAAVERISKVLSWQHAEGWYNEYGGADPGYQTVTIDCLAKWFRLTGCRRSARSLRYAVQFARSFLHPDGSYAGEYGSRGTYHFYPHGMELLASDLGDAADLADGFLHGLGQHRQGYFDDDRMFAHRLGNLIEAWIDWSPLRPAASELPPSSGVQYYPAAQLLVARNEQTHLVVSAARGGVFKLFQHGKNTSTDAGLILELEDGRVAVSQQHHLSRLVIETASQGPAHSPGATFDVGDSQGVISFPLAAEVQLSVTGPLHFSQGETATPLKQAIFHLGMITVGRFCRGLIRGLLQRRLITGRRQAPVRLTRQIALSGPGSDSVAGSVRVIDTIELTSARAKVARMSFGVDHQSAYVAASSVYQESVRQPWTDLSQYVEELNIYRQVTITREFPATIRPESE